MTAWVEDVDRRRFENSNAVRFDPRWSSSDVCW